MSKIVKKSALDELLDEWRAWRGKGKADWTDEPIKFDDITETDSAPDVLAKMAERIDEHRKEQRSNHLRFMAQCAAAFVAGMAIILTLLLIVPSWAPVVMKIIIIGAIAALIGYIMNQVQQLRRL